MRPATNVLVMALLLVPCSARAQQATAEWTAEQREVLAALSDGPVGIEDEASFEAWAGGYHPDWTYWRLGTDTTRPRDEHMQLVRAYVGEGNRVVDFELEPVDVILRGDTAVVRLNATETIDLAEGGTRVARYSSVAVLAREQDRWLLLASNLLHLPDGD